LAKEYLLKSLQLKADKNKTALLSELGNNYYYLQKYDSAFYYYTLANEKANFFKDTLGIAYTLNNLGLYYKAKGDFSTAIHYFQNAIIFYQNINNRYGIINSHSNIAQIYFLEKKYFAAIEICLKFYQEAKENESYELIFELSKVLAESYEKIKNYEKSVIYYKEFIIAKDSIFQSKFKMLNSDYEHKLLILQNKKENNWKDFIDIWFYLFVLIFLISILLVIFIIWITKKYEIRWSRIINS
jgi:tetratricopeptide (TPR) repeat protein